MSRTTVKHYRQSNVCPSCGARVWERQYTSLTTYICSNQKCEWTLDWERKQDLGTSRWLKQLQDEDEDFS